MFDTSCQRREIYIKFFFVINFEIYQGQYLDKEINDMIFCNFTKYKANITVFFLLLFFFFLFNIC